MTPSSRPIAIVPSASKTGSPVSTVSPTPSSASTSPTSAPRSSSSTTGSSGTLDWRMNCHQVPSPFSGRDSTIAVRNEKLSSPIATTRMPDRDQRRGQRLVLLQLVDALVEREHRAEA